MSKYTYFNIDVEIPFQCFVLLHTYSMNRHVACVFKHHDKTLLAAGQFTDIVGRWFYCYGGIFALLFTFEMKTVKREVDLQ